MKGDKNVQVLRKQTNNVDIVEQMLARGVREVGEFCLKVEFVQVARTTNDGVAVLGELDSQSWIDAFANSAT